MELSQHRGALWQDVYGPREANPEEASLGLLVAIMMDGYVKAIQPRPPGNIHAMQSLNFSGFMPQYGDMLSLDFSIGSKELKRERRWVDFDVTVRAGDRVAMTGKIRSIWAA